MQDLKKREIVKKAKQLYEEGDYSEAYFYYKEVSTFRKRRREVWYRLGYCALYANDYRTAMQAFKKVVKHDDIYPEVQFYYASSLKRNGKYEAAMEQFNFYIRKHVQLVSNRYVDVAKSHLNACAEAIRQEQEDAKGYVENMGEELNSKADEGGYTGKSKQGFRLIEYRDEFGSHLQRIENGTAPKLLSGTVGNKAMQVSSPFISPLDSVTVFFSKMDENPRGELESKIYVGRINDDGEIVDIRKLGVGVNRDGFSSKDPVIGVTEHGQEILYFSSTLPGGEGGTDIWYAIRMKNGEFTRAYNLGMRINSPYQEVTPYYHHGDGHLYYSSDNPNGFGGLDVFKMRGEKMRWDGQRPTHLSAPINSAGDDYYFRIDEKGRGYLSSNRESAQMDAYGRQSYDIYRFTHKDYEARQKEVKAAGDTLGKTEEE